MKWVGTIESTERWTDAHGNMSKSTRIAGAAGKRDSNKQAKNTYRTGKKCKEHALDKNLVNSTVN